MTDPELIAESVRCEECGVIVPADQLVMMRGPGTVMTSKGVEWEPHPFCRPCYIEMFGEDLLEGL